METEEGQGPDPSDIDGWRRIIDAGQLRGVRLEEVVAAVQQIGPFGERRVLNALMQRVSDRMTQILRQTIGRNHPNDGLDMIEQAHGKLIESVLRPESADGAALKVAFRARVEHRAADAIRAGRKESSRYPYSEDRGVLPSPDKNPWRPEDEHLHVEQILQRIADLRKQLAFRLHMDGVPKESKKVESIAAALNVSAKTVGTWIAEIEEQIKPILGDRQ